MTVVPGVGTLKTPAEAIVAPALPDTVVWRVGALKTPAIIVPALPDTVVKDVGPFKTPAAAVVASDVDVRRLGASKTDARVIGVN